MVISSAGGWAGQGSIVVLGRGVVRGVDAFDEGMLDLFGRPRLVFCMKESILFVLKKIVA
jgi:hypothetical protein